MQIAALPWQIDAEGKLRVLLITSRTNAKWMLPKGWPMAGKDDAEVALIEAWEEAGIVGVVSPRPVGSYRYIKVFEDGSARPAQATIFPIRVTEQSADWDERSQRQRKWFRPRKAAEVAFEADLARFLLGLAQKRVMLS